MYHNHFQIVSCVIDPLLLSVTESASHLPTVDMAVYLLNCLYQMQSTLAMYEYMDGRMERLQGKICILYIFKRFIIINKTLNYFA